MSAPDRWFVGDMKKEVANRLVLSGPHGTFLVRMSTAGDRYVLTVNDSGSIAPYQVKMQAGKYMWRETSFNDLDSVVQDVITSPFDGPSGLPLVLAHPASGGQIHPSTQARINAQGGGAASQSNPFGEPPAQTAPAAQSGGGGEEDYVLYQALYAYTSDDADDLKFDANDIIQVTDEDEYPAKCWMEGRVNGSKIGSFPSNFVRKININKGSAPRGIDSYGS